MSTRNAGRALCALAALSAAAALVVHLTIGERDIGQAILAAGDLSDRVRLSAYLGWHGLTVLLALFVILCLRAAILGGPTLAPVATWIGATSIGVIALVLDYRETPGGAMFAMAAPQWLFAAPIALFSGLGASLLAYARVPARKRRKR